MNFRATTSAVLKSFDHRFIEMVINVLEQRNVTRTDTDGLDAEIFTDTRKGYGLLVLVNERNSNHPFTITTEFLVPSNELAASFMVMWRRWCNKKNINTRDGLLSIIKRVTEEMEDHIAQGNEHSVSNLAIGLMGAVLDNYPEVISSMRWSIDNNFAPCLVITNEKRMVKCAVCFGGKYKTT